MSADDYAGVSQSKRLTSDDLEWMAFIKDRLSPEVVSQYLVKYQTRSYGLKRQEVERLWVMAGERYSTDHLKGIIYGAIADFNVSGLLFHSVRMQPESRAFSTGALDVVAIVCECIFTALVRRVAYGYVVCCRSVEWSDFNEMLLNHLVLEGAPLIGFRGKVVGSVRSGNICGYDQLFLMRAGRLNELRKRELESYWERREEVLKDVSGPLMDRTMRRIDEFGLDEAGSDLYDGDYPF